MTATSSLVSAPRRLLAVLVTSFALLLSVFVTAQPAQAQSLTSSQLATRIAATVNSLRHAHHVPALRANSSLNAVASTHSKLMASHNTLSYQLSGESSVTTRIYRAGFSSSYAYELLADSRSQAGLLLKPYEWARNPLRAQVLFNRHDTYMGVGVYHDTTHNRYWVTLELARPRASLQGVIAAAVLRQLNHERAVHGLPALAMNSRLVISAHRHNLAMAKYNTMSHQLPGELSLGARILLAGYTWRTAGENVGWNSVMTQSGALYLETIMYNEQPPNDGHRLNILNRTYRHVGIDIALDYTHHKLWLTEDFGSPLL